MDESFRELGGWEEERGRERKRERVKRERERAERGRERAERDSSERCTGEPKK